jgi:hypothetical protein
MANKLHVSKELFIKRINDKTYRSLTIANRAIGKSLLSNADKDACKQTAFAHFKGKVSAKKSARKALRVGAFLAIKSRLESGGYSSYSYFSRGVARSPALSADERKSLLVAGKAHFDSATRTGLKKVTFKRKKELSHHFKKEDDFFLSFINLNLSEPGFNEKMERVLAGAASEGKTLIQMLELVRALKR